MVQYLHNYERSNHDISYAWRSTLAPGVLVPCMAIIMTPGDNFEVEMDTMILTLPTVGPLFGTYKQQIDLFVVPLRLYQAQIHNNKIGVGRSMKDIKIPQIEMEMNNLDINSEEPLDIQQISTSSLLRYLGLSGLGYSESNEETVRGSISANEVLAYYDICKNYYANLQEEEMAFIDYPNVDISNISTVKKNGTAITYPSTLGTGDVIEIQGVGLEAIDVRVGYNGLAPVILKEWSMIEVLEDTPEQIVFFIPNQNVNLTLDSITLDSNKPSVPGPNVVMFPTENIDNMREDILSRIKETEAFVIDATTYAPYGNNVQTIGGASGSRIRSYLPMQGLCCKTYQSDIYQNWMNAEWIDGAGSATELSNIDVSDGILNLDSLNIAQKVYNFMNRVIMAGGTYYNWIEAGWGVKVAGHCETPMYCGGCSREVTFASVVSQSATGEEPLGSLAGRGVYEGKQKGGRVVIRCMDNEPCIAMGIVSLTPRIDYSQGNQWNVHLKTWDDFHKPEFDGIGYQDLVTDQMAFWDTARDDDGNAIFKSAGKTVAWINYMTNVNKTYGDFADPNKEMFMTLNRRYEPGAKIGSGIKDLTTYIDPAKYNYIFANTKRNAQNFQVQVGFGIKARRKLSARQIPNL